MTASLAGKRVLVVEDEYLIAADLRRALEQADAQVVGPVGQAERGLSLAQGEPLDAAVLDVNLAGNRSYAIAGALEARGVPFLFLTGYDGWALPEELRDAPRVAKPTTMGRVVDGVRQPIATGG